LIRIGKIRERENGNVGLGRKERRRNGREIGKNTSEG
jgi:hypothetical protein